MNTLSEISSGDVVRGTLTRSLQDAISCVATSIASIAAYFWVWGLRFRGWDFSTPSIVDLTRRCIGAIQLPQVQST